MIEAVAADEPLAHRILRERGQPDSVASRVVQAVLAGLSGNARDSGEALLRARSEFAPEHEFLLELLPAFILVETGAPARAAAPLGRARRSLARSADPCGKALLLLLQAQSVLTRRRPVAARALAADGQRSIPPGEEHLHLRTYAALVHATVALEAGDLPGAEREFQVAARARSGIIAARVDVLRARLRFRRSPDGRAAAAADLDRAINRLTVIGAARDLGLACLERALQAGSEPAGSAAHWLARAKSHLASSGGPRDLRALRSACDALEQRLSPPAELATDGTAVGRLAVATRELSAIEEHDDLLAAIPRLALVACPGTGAHLVRVRRDAPPEVLATSGAEISLRGGALAQRVLQALPTRGSPAVSDAASMAILPVGHAEDGMALIVDRVSAMHRIGEQDLERLAIYASFAAVLLVRASSRAAVREATARASATLAAIRDPAVVTDERGTVRALNSAAAAAMGVKREEAVGRRFDELPGLSPLAVALDGFPRTVEVVPLPRGDVMMRPHAYEGGMVLTLRNAASAQTIDKRAAPSFARFTFEHLIGQDPAFVEVAELARRAAASDLPILITGESGTGKELLAQAIHNVSEREAAPFVGVNVTAIPRELVESELFGYEAGTFTGARTGGMPGKFELAGRGTLLLDEIGDMPIETQAKLLRVLQEKIVHRIGSAAAVPVRARVIATTHRDLAQAVGDGGFRLDLYHRLRVLHLHIPALRERKRDIRPIAEHQLKLYAESARRGPIRLSPVTAAALEAYDWPGNVRELCNVIESEASQLLPGEDVISRVPRALLHIGIEAVERAPAGPVLPLEEVERRACVDALRYFAGNVARAARALGLAKTTLYSKMKKYGIEAAETAAGDTSEAAKASITKI
ncbi:MAG: sigma 54-interacting transcriptional regulator [Myxococcales bacterium]